MEVISLRTAQERHLLAERTYRYIQARKMQKRQAQGEILDMKKKRKTKRLRKITQNTRY